MALRKMAQVCEQERDYYMRDHNVQTNWAAAEQVMMCVDDQPQAQNLIRRGWRMADRYHTALLAGLAYGGSLSHRPAGGAGVWRIAITPPCWRWPHAIGHHMRVHLAGRT